jgi:hypothetical protein
LGGLVISVNKPLSDVRLKERSDVKVNWFTASQEHDQLPK